MGDFEADLRQAMLDRGVVQQELARQSGVSQGHISKVLRSARIGRRTRERLQKWLDHPDQTEREEVVGPDDLMRIGTMLKRHCDELALISRRMGASARQDASSA